MPRRLLAISHSYVVGTNRALPNALAARGWEVTVAAPAQLRGDLRSIVLESAETDKARVVPVNVHGSRFAHVMRWGSGLRELLREPWDIVHAWEEPYVLAGAQIARWHQRGALVYSTFQNIAKRYPPPFSWFESYSLGRAAGWIAFGRTVEETLARRQGYGQVPHRQIPPAIDVDRFAGDEETRSAVRDELKTSPGEVLIGFVGRFVPAKGLALLTAALDAMTAPWRAVFVGGGPLERTLLHWSARHGDRVRVLTGVTHARVPRYLNALDVLAVPSLTTRRWREQFGRVIVEGMAAGVAVVASDSGEIPHVAADAALVVPEGNVAVWATALDRLASEPELRQRLAASGLQRAQQFSAANVAGAHDEFFTALLEGRR